MIKAVCYSGDQPFVDPRCFFIVDKWTGKDRVYNALVERKNAMLRNRRIQKSVT